MTWQTSFMCAIALTCLCVSQSSAALQEVASWNLLSFDFANGGQEQELTFNPQNTVLTGLEVGGSKLFLAAPRLWSGVPATISTVPLNNPPGSSPVLEPFPDWSWHDAGKGVTNCSGLISVYRMRADRCDRIWVLDSGVMDSIDNFTRVCPPKLMVFDMNGGRPMRSVTFPDELVRTNSLFTNLVIDETTSSPYGNCDDVFVYITDTAAPGMVVYDAAADSAWRITHAAMYPDPDFSEYRIGSDRFTLMDGIVGLAFSPNLRTLYFQPLATDRTFSISTEYLRRGPPAVGEELPVVLVGRKASQGLGLAVDPFSDTLFYSPITETALAAWNPRTNEHGILSFDPDRIQFAAEVRWIGRDQGRVWALTTRFQKFFLRTVNAQETNIRVLRVVPDPPRPSWQQGGLYGPPRYYRSTSNATATY